GMPTDGLTVTTSTVLTALAVGFGVTVIGGVVPAWRSSRVAPLAALREVEVDQAATSKVRAALGALVALAGGALLLAGPAGKSLVRPGLGAVGLVIGVLLLGPVVARPIGSALGAPLAVRGVSGELARRNA